MRSLEILILLTIFHSRWNRPKSYVATRKQVFDVVFFKKIWNSINFIYTIQLEHQICSRKIADKQEKFTFINFPICFIKCLNDFCRTTNFIFYLLVDFLVTFHKIFLKFLTSFQITIPHSTHKAWIWDLFKFIF